MRQEDVVGDLDTRAPRRDVQNGRVGLGVAAGQGRRRGRLLAWLASPVQHIVRHHFLDHVPQIIGVPPLKKHASIGSPAPASAGRRGEPAEALLADHTDLGERPRLARGRAADDQRDVVMRCAKLGDLPKVHETTPADDN